MSVSFDPRWLEVVGASCDWGGCDEPAVAARYAPDLEQALAVCTLHLDGAPVP